MQRYLLPYTALICGEEGAVAASNQSATPRDQMADLRAHLAVGRPAVRNRRRTKQRCRDIAVRGAGARAVKGSERPHPDERAPVSWTGHTAWRGPFDRGDPLEGASPCAGRCRPSAQLIGERSPLVQRRREAQPCLPSVTNDGANALSVMLQTAGCRKLPEVEAGRGLHGERGNDKEFGCVMIPQGLGLARIARRILERDKSPGGWIAVAISTSMAIGWVAAEALPGNPQIVEAEHV